MNIIKKLILLSLVVTFAMFGNGCKKENVTPSAAATTDPVVGSWKVSSFVKRQR